VVLGIRFFSDSARICVTIYKYSLSTYIIVLICQLADISTRYIYHYALQNAKHKILHCRTPYDNWCLFNVLRFLTF